MKRFLIWSSIGLIVAAVGIVVLRADDSPWRRYRGGGWHHHTPLAYLSHELKLSDTQQAQIKSMWQAERPAIGSLAQEFAEESKKMDAATAKGNQDPERIQSIAERQGQTIAKFLVEKERFKAMVYTTVLNEEQRDKADQIQKTWLAQLEHIAEKIASGDGSALHR